MWNRYRWLTLYVRVRRKGKRGALLWLPPLSLYILRGVILNFDGILGLIPGKAGRALRAGADTLQKAVNILQSEGMEANVKINNPEMAVKVNVKTL